MDSCLLSREKQKGSSVGTLNYLCPTLRREVASGIAVDQATYDLARLEIVRVKCSACGGGHRFLMADGWLDEGEDSTKLMNPLVRTAA